MKRLCATVFLLLVPMIALAQQPTLAPKPDNVAPGKHGTGLVLPSLEVRRANHQAEARRHAIHHAKMAMRLSEPLPTSYDCCAIVSGSSTISLVTPIEDQGPVGTCHDFSGVGVVESANIKNHNLPNSTAASQLSEQFIVDLNPNNDGGCNGGDASTIFEWLKAGNGIPLASVYGPYTASCRQSPQLSTTATGYTINDWGYVSSSTGIPNADLIKAAMLQFGPISVCVAADGRMQSYTGCGVFTDTGATSIDHQVILVGWDDAKGAWKMRNSWNTNWGCQGYMWIAYGANQIGTEAMWVTAGTPVTIQPSSQPQPNPTPTPTRRALKLQADYAAICSAIADRWPTMSEQDKTAVLSLLEQHEQAAKGMKQSLGLAK